MSKIPNFENFEVSEAIVAAGFGMNNIQNFGLGGGTPQTGYSMGAIAGTVGTSADAIGSQANEYEMNDNDDHTAEGYLEEAKKHVNESIDKAYESCKAMDEGMSKSAIKKSIKVIDKMIDTETGGDGEPLDNETLQALEQEKERLETINEEYGTDESQYSLKDRKKLRATEQKLWSKTKKALEEQIRFYVMNRTDIKIAGFKGKGGSPLEVKTNIQFIFEQFLKNYINDKWATVDNSSGPK